ncbi:hypothetical protein BRC64_05900 [Halobacteriales archaeon QH_10_67_22]|nr:MAG: hypothetical protein BRC64_05900 [Halobacteriales archaeon QH_10_67_22]
MSPLLDALGPRAIVPDEPRTQGHWTPPSHGSMFTGTHPGDHGYVGVDKQEGDDRPINPEMETLASVLADNGYKNSALASHGRIRRQFGFGRGFHRFVHDGMDATDWVERKHDARRSVDRLVEQIDADASHRDHNLFYFLHLFDAHSPYIPPTYMLDDDRIDFSSPWEYNRIKNEFWDETDQDYVKTYNADIEVDDEVVDLMQSYYEQSVRYTARLVRHLKTVGLFKQSLIIVTGDHGEEWGERGFFTHTSTYDANIRPFMAVKPPRSADWSVRDAVDTIDFLPTVSTLVGEEPPAHCRGRPLQDGPVENRVWITERLSPDWYSVAVERGEDKGIFTYESNYPDRPPESDAEAGPELVEFYSLPAVREGNCDQAAVSVESRTFLKNRPGSSCDEERWDRRRPFETPHSPARRKNNSNCSGTSDRERGSRLSL